MFEDFSKSFYFWLIPTSLILIWYLKDIFFMLFFSFVLGIAVQEWAIAIKKYFKIPFIINIILIYLIFVSILIFSIYFFLPVMIKEIKNFYPHVQDLLETYGIKNIDKYLKNFFQENSLTVVNFSSYFFNLIGGLFNFIFIIILSFYIATQINFFPDIFRFIFKEKYKNFFNLYLRIRRKFSFWLAAQIFLMLIIGVLVYLLMIILKIPYASLIALISGLMELVPVLGPIISAALAIFITFANVPEKVLWVLAGFILIQQLENNLIIPLLTRRILEIKPLITLTAILVGGKLGGILGILTILPFSVILIEIYYEFFNLNNLRKNLILKNA